MKQYNLDNISDLREAFARYGAPLEDIPVDSSAKHLLRIGNSRLNKYPNLVKNNLKVFFPNEKSIPEDALDDYDAEETSPYYVTLSDLLEDNLQPGDWMELKGMYGKMIIDELEKANKASLSKEDTNKLLDDMSWGVPANIMDAVNRKY